MYFYWKTFAEIDFLRRLKIGGKLLEPKLFVELITSICYIFERICAHK